MLSCQLCLGLAYDVFPSYFPTRAPIVFLISPMRANLSAYLIIALNGTMIYKLVIRTNLEGSGRGLI
jgi:hypothetical protein